MVGSRYEETTYVVDLAIGRYRVGSRDSRSGRLDAVVCIPGFHHQLFSFSSLRVTALAYTSVSTWRKVPRKAGFGGGGKARCGALRGTRENCTLPRFGLNCSNKGKFPHLERAWPRRASPERSGPRMNPLLDVCRAAADFLDLGCDKLNLAELPGLQGWGHVCHSYRGDSRRQWVVWRASR
jgi:hypothetical protein